VTEADPDLLARAQLRERQGAGARYDAPNAPADDLLLARRGTAYFARQLNGLTDSELDAQSAVAGQSRRHIVAEVAFQARWLARLAAAARLGFEVETIVEPELFIEDVKLTATLPPHALRYLFQHSAVHLDVEWRDLPREGWSRTIISLDGRAVPINATPLMRAQEIWMAATTLGGHWRLSDIPAVIIKHSDIADLRGSAASGA
jgi:maleylpyruvate isomerase